MEGLEAAVMVVVVVVLIVAAGENLRGHLGGHDVAAAAAGVVVFLVVLLLRLLSLPRADDGVDAPFGLLLGAAGGQWRMEKTPLVLTPAEVIAFLAPALLLLHHWCRCMHELLLLPLVAIAHAVDEAVEHGEVGPLGGDGVLPKLKL